MQSAVIDELRLDPELFSGIKSKAVVRSILLAEANRQRIEAGDLDRKKALTGLRTALGLARKSALDTWAEENMLAGGKFDELVDDEARIDKVMQSASVSIGHHIIAILQLDGVYAKLAKRADKKRRVLAKHGFGQDSQAAEMPPPPLVLNWFFGSRLQQPVPLDIDSFVEELGIRERQDFYRLLAAEYVYLSLSNIDSDGET
jgi:hypothetical protein